MMVMPRNRSKNALGSAAADPRVNPFAPFLRAFAGNGSRQTETEAVLPRPLAQRCPTLLGHLLAAQGIEAKAERPQRAGHGATVQDRLRRPTTRQ